VAHIDRPTRDGPPDSASRLSDAMKLAEQLGAATVVLTADDLVEAVLDYARRSNVTQIVVGKSHQPRWKAILRRPLTPALLERTAGAALHIVTETVPPGPRQAAPRAKEGRQSWLGHLGAAAAVAVATGAAELSETLNAGANLSMIFMLSVLATGLAFGLWPALVAAGLAAFVYNFLFLPPRLTVWIGHPADVLTFAVFFAVAVATGWLTGRVRDHAEAAARRASAVTALLAASRRLSIAATREDVALPARRRRHRPRRRLPRA
jgi:two-component system sensor histidine kinase KdpD